MTRKMPRLLPVCLVLSGCAELPTTATPPPAAPPPAAVAPATAGGADAPVIFDPNSQLPDVAPSPVASLGTDASWQQWLDTAQSAQSQVDADIPMQGLLPDPLPDNAPALPLMDWPQVADAPYGTLPAWLVHGEPYSIHTLKLGRRQEGDASWYGPGFHGKRTASGEIFNMNALTAAHRTLPLPSLVRVTNLANQQSVIVRVNDRGPFHSNRIIDLSYAAAKRIGLLSVGRVAIEPVGKEEATQDDDVMRPGITLPTNTAYLLCIGPYRRADQADALQARLIDHLPGIPVTVTAGRQPYADAMVEIGPLVSIREADVMVRAIRANRFGLLVDTSFPNFARKTAPLDTPAAPPRAHRSRHRGK